MRPLRLDDPDVHMRAPVDATPFLVFTLAWLVLVWPWLSGRYQVPWDAKAEFLPQIQFLAASLARGESPFWNPFVFSGFPQVADPQSMIFSPPFLILALLNGSPGGWSVDMTVFAAILVGGWALIAWFADRGWHWVGAVIAALVFAFGASMAWRIQHTGQVLSLSLLPVTWLLLDKALARRSVWLGLAAGFAGAFMVLGRDQVALLGVYLLAAYVVWNIFSSRDPSQSAKRAALPLVAGAIAGVITVAVPVLLTAALATQSNRPEIGLAGAGAGSLHPAYALTFFAPDVFGATGSQGAYWGPPSFAWPDTELYLAQNMGELYVGAIPALLILMGFGSGIVFRRQIIFFTTALLLMTLYAAGWYTPFFAFAHTFIPGVDLYRRPADAVFLMGFLGAIVAGYSAHALIFAARMPAPYRLRNGMLVALGCVVTAFVACVVIAVRMDHLAMAWRPVAAAAALFAIAATALVDAAWLAPIRPRIAAALLIAVSVVDLGYSNGPNGSTAADPLAFDVLNPKTANQTIVKLKALTAQSQTPNRRDRIELVGLGFVWPNASMTHRLENTLGYNPVRLAQYAIATGAEDTVGVPEQRKFAPLFPGYKSQLADLLGLRYIATSVPLQQIDPAAKSEDFPLVAKTPDGFIYENPRAMPRLAFAPSAAPADFDAILHTGRWPVDVDLSGTVLLSPDDDRDSSRVATRGTGTATLVSYTNTRVEIDVESTRGGFVVLNDLWHPWWVATVDGKPETVLRANVLFRAIRVPYGRHRIVYNFAPLANLSSR